MGSLRGGYDKSQSECNVNEIEPGLKDLFGISNESSQHVDWYACQRWTNGFEAFCMTVANFHSIRSLVKKSFSCLPSDHLLFWPTYRNRCHLSVLASQNTPSYVFLPKPLRSLAYATLLILIFPLLPLHSISFASKTSGPHLSSVTSNLIPKHSFTHLQNILKRQLHPWRCPIQQRPQIILHFPFFQHSLDSLKIRYQVSSCIEEE